MPETIIDSILQRKITPDVLVKWLNDQPIEDSPEYGALFCCSRSEFVAYFLSFIRNQTESILQTNSNAFNLIHQGTPEKIFSSKRKHRRSISEPTSELEIDQSSDKLNVKTDHNRSHESPNRDRSNQKKCGRRVKTKLFNETEKSKDQSSSFLTSKTDSDESKLSIGVEKLIVSSTPQKNSIEVIDYPNLSFSSPVTPQSRSFGNFERCDTPKMTQRHSKSQEKSSFGDFLLNAQVKSSKKKRLTPKNISKEAEDGKTSLDLSSSEMFPEIGARKSSSLRSEKRRIKPTNLNSSTPQKSFSLNSFNSESFQQPSPLVLEENLAFKQQNLQPKEFSNTYDAERNILKQERHKLMEKFNVLNISGTQKSPTVQQIKISRAESMEKSPKLIVADSTKIIFKDKIDNIVETYDILLKNNLILSMSTEIYFLITILLSKQYEDDYLSVSSKTTEETVTECILKTIHNSTYFAVKSLWYQKHVLGFVLDKNSLKILGENKKVRSFYPDLAKFLLNLYGIKSESDVVKDDKVIVLDSRFSNGMVCFNFETDNADNFPSLLSFQNFKKQRDLFYEILRWYNDSQQTAGSKATFRTRVKTLLSLAVSASNHAHLARLFTKHMLSECLPASQQESKLSKLQRRLTGPSTHESNRIPRFSSKEMFYKEFMIFAENESFRAHLRDSLSSEIVTLNSTTIGNLEERVNSSNPDISKEYLNLLRKLTLLAKFLGYLTALPYTQIPTEYTIKTRSVHNYEQKEQNFVAPKEKVLENDLGMRNYSQPTIDLKLILSDANQNGRLSITLPWLSQYLSMLDYSSLRTKYYEELLKNIFEIYIRNLKINNENSIKRNTLIFLKLTLGWLFDLPHFPQEVFYEKTLVEPCIDTTQSIEDSIDSLDIIDESILFEACPFLKDLNVLLFTSKPAQEVKDVGSFRHITPVSIGLNPEDRIRNKEKEIQARLEEEFLKAQPSSTRRVLELVAERVSSHCVKQLPSLAREAREKCTIELASLLASDLEGDPLTLATQMYSAALENLRTAALEMCQKQVLTRCRVALQALLSTGGRALTHVAAKACMAKLARWLADHWTGIHILCKDIPGEIANLQVLADNATKEEDNAQAYNTDSLTLPSEQFDKLNVSPNNVIIDLKEQICLLLEYRALPSPLAPLLAQVAGASSRDNVLTRVPTRRALLQLTTDLCLVMVSRKPKEVTEELLNNFDAVWNVCCPDRKRKAEVESVRAESPVDRNFDREERAATPISDEEAPSQPFKFIYPPIAKNTPISPKTPPIYPKPHQNSPIYHKGLASPGLSGSLSPNCKGQLSPNMKRLLSPNMEVKQENYQDYFDRILCPRNIVILSVSKCDETQVWLAMARMLVFLLKSDYLSEDSLTEQCLAIYRQDWPQKTLENLSLCLHAVCDSTKSSTSKLTLFLQFLAEYCLHMD